MFSLISLLVIDGVLSTKRLMRLSCRLSVTRGRPLRGLLSPLPVALNRSTQFCTVDLGIFRVREISRTDRPSL